jgi:Trk-type K+ transport system membrane component
MVMGRVGVFAFTVAIVGKITQSRIKYAEGRIVL